MGIDEAKKITENYFKASRELSMELNNYCNGNRSKGLECIEPQKQEVSK